jgi:hypothetical protein
LIENRIFFFIAGIDLIRQVSVFEPIQ